MHTWCQMMHEGRLVQWLLLWSQVQWGFSVHSTGSVGRNTEKSPAVIREWDLLSFTCSIFEGFFFMLLKLFVFFSSPRLWALTLPSMKMWPGMFPTGHQLTVVVRYDYLLHSNCYRSSLWNAMCTVWLYIRITSHIWSQLLSFSDANSVDLKVWLRLNEAQGRKPWDITYVDLKKKKRWMRSSIVFSGLCDSKSQSGRRFSKLVSFCCVVVSTDPDRRASCVNLSPHC